MPTFKVRVTRVTTEVYLYKTTAEHLAAAQTTAEGDDPDPEYLKAHTVIKRVAVAEVQKKF